MQTPKQLSLFVILAYALSWLVWSVPMLRMGGDYRLENLGIFFLIGSFGPSVAALVVTALSEGGSGVRRLLARLVRWRVGWQPYVIVVFLVPLIFLATFLASGLPVVEGMLPDLFANLVLLVPIGILAAIIVGAGPLGEELGWRGFALPRLLEQFGDLGSSVILGVIWAFWHLPIFLFADWRNGLSLGTFTLLYPLTLICISIAMTKLWHWTGGSVLLAILLHGSINFVTGAIVDPGRFELASRSNVGVYFIAIAAFAALALVFWLLDKWLGARRDVRVAEVKQ